MSKRQRKLDDVKRATGLVTEETEGKEKVQVMDMIDMMEPPVSSGLSPPVVGAMRKVLQATYRVFFFHSTDF